MLRVDTKSGHGSGKPTSKTIEEITDVYSFLVRSLNLEYKKGRTDVSRSTRRLISHDENPSSN